MITVRNITVKVIEGPAAQMPLAGVALAANAQLVGPGKVDEQSVRAACREVLAQAASTPAVVLPAFGVDAPAGGFPPVACAKIMAQEILRSAREARPGAALREITVCLPTGELKKLFEQQVIGYLRHVIEDLAWGPYVTADIIIEVEGGIVLIERTNPPFGWALPGGFVDREESLETAARREAREETGLELEDLNQFHTYSEPGRDPRFHTVTAVFTAKGVGTPRAGDDAKGIKVVPLSQLRGRTYPFDHARVIEDYLKSRGF